MKRKGWFAKLFDDNKNRKIIQTEYSRQQLDIREANAFLDVSIPKPEKLIGGTEVYQKEGLPYWFCKIGNDEFMHVYMEDLVEEDLYYDFKKKEPRKNLLIIPYKSYESLYGVIFTQHYNYGPEYLPGCKEFPLKRENSFGYCIPIKRTEWNKESMIEVMLQEECGMFYSDHGFEDEGSMIEHILQEKTEFNSEDIGREYPAPEVERNYRLQKEFEKNVFEALKNKPKEGYRWIPVYEPSLKRGRLQFVKGKEPFVCSSYSEWEKLIREYLPENESSTFSTNTYFLLLLRWLKDRIATIDQLVSDSKDIGHFEDSPNAKHGIEHTGEREFGGLYGFVGNTVKIMQGSNGRYCNKGNYDIPGDLAPLAKVEKTYRIDWLYHEKYSLEEEYREKMLFLLELKK